MNPPLVSIALVTFNGETHLPAQLESLLQQSHPALELVACDDASTDGTWQVLERFAPRFEARGTGVRLLRNPDNIGVRRNVEQALRQCSGSWIAPCDQDDVWRPDKIERMLRVAGGATLVYSDSALIDEEGKSLQTRVSDRLTMIDGSDPRLFALANCVSGHAMLLRRGLLDRALPLPDVSFHDWWLAFVAANIGTVRYLDEPLVEFRQHRRNVSTFTGGRDRERSSEREKQAARQRDFDALASFQGPQQPFFRSLAAAWAERPQRAFTPRLVGLLWRHRGLVFASKKHAPGGARHALKYLWGLRLQR
jgi:glycosyltransferase involved in cell wall biosynthesis